MRKRICVELKRKNKRIQKQRREKENLARSIRVLWQLYLMVKSYVNCLYSQQYISAYNSVRNKCVEFGGDLQAPASWHIGFFAVKLCRKSYAQVNENSFIVKYI